MAQIRYVTGDATRPLGAGPKIIAHVCNDTGGWGRGFVVALSRRWPEPERAYRAWHRDGAALLGEAQLVAVEPGLWVANMVGQHGLRRAGNRPPIRYDALRRCLASVAEEAAALVASVHMPRIGAGLAGGRWEEIEPIIVDEVVAKGIQVTVYDLE
ncbi:O-acetyl-ADP-ribose deacetylase (regulator of RNase III) [Asanoa ferruginea]|uniref:O-acetyl-ADP-ribose deacetylase (Regulator of RNase III) n=1 Tax=Asanoa ferruginea TaxID=53367 RepID=A0A3D9ZAX8_9ACTN|nr:macro domain-containing protein [Asanoa ferruginea]REF94445.1 O-acetyl-ADP-ribose deacetylase (regulator of RNase III) [Asanoa ferruginea]GIF52219.1 Appr-1-p processing protein [Asanoa ferruginea]